MFRAESARYNEQNARCSEHGFENIYIYICFQISLISSEINLSLKKKWQNVEQFHTSISIQGEGFAIFWEIFGSRKLSIQGKPRSEFE